MPDANLWEHFDNDIIHIGRSILGDRYKRRGNFISKKQLRFIVMSEVHKEIYVHSDFWNKEERSFGDFVNLISDKILEFATSVDGYALNITAESVRNRLAVNDIIRQKKGSAEVDLEKM